MRISPTLLAAAVLATAAVPASAVGAQDVLHAVSIVPPVNHVFYPERALGEPDGQHASFLTKDTFVLFDFETDATGPLTLTYQLLDFGAIYRVEFLDALQNVVAAHADYFPPGTDVSVDPATDTAYRLAKIISVNEKPWNLDALSASPVPGADEEQEGGTDPGTDTEDGQEPVAEPSTLTRGSLIKLADDGDPATTYDSAVYVIGAEGARHAFPSETVFFSWFQDFSGVQVVSPETIASYPLGRNVTMRPGTNLVKLQTDPKTYAVYPGGVLRWIPTEDIALTLFGMDWVDLVVDVADVFFGNYAVGEDLNASSLAPAVDPHVPYPY